MVIKKKSVVFIIHILIKGIGSVKHIYITGNKFIGASATYTYFSPFPLLRLGVKHS